MNRRRFLATASAGAWARPVRTSAAQSRPNFVVLLADDLGYGDVHLGLNGLNAFQNPYIRTPHLAALARQSRVFTHHYSASPVCSPSRAGLLTGRTPSRLNIDLWINDLSDNDRMFLSGKEVTIPELLGGAGYQTAIFGKWHLNGADWEQKSNWSGWTGSFPQQQGFQHGLVTKENPHATRELKLNSQENPGDYFHLDGTPAGPLSGFSSSIIVDRAVEWLQKQRDKTKPFFLYLPFDAVHEIVSSPPEFTRLYKTGNPDKDAYYANVTFLDAQIGRFVRALDRMGLGGDTVVLFSSDNGPDELNCNHLTQRSYGTSYPLFGQKRQVFEGGIRVPGMVRWPGRIAPGVSGFPNFTLDVLPTFCELAGVTPRATRPLDGISIAPHLLRNAVPERRQAMYWHFQRQARNWRMVGEGYDRRFDGKQPSPEPVPHVAIRRDRLVLRRYSDGRCVLFDVVADPLEQQELSTAQPDAFQRMVRELETIHAGVLRDQQRQASEISRRVDQRP